MNEHVFHPSLQSSSLISNATATALLSLGSIDYCLHVLKSLLEFWKSQQGEEEPTTTSQLLRPHTASSPPDMSPFFLRQYVKVPGFVNVLLIETCFSLLMWIDHIIHYPTGTCFWCVWGLLSATDWNGVEAAVSNKKDCRHKPPNPTSCFWPLLVLLSVRSKQLKRSQSSF